MGFSDKFKDMVLNNSDKYNFYKKEYENLSINYKKLKRENKNLKKRINNAKNKNIYPNDFNDFLINSYYSPFINAPFTGKQIKCFNFMDTVAEHLIKNVEKLEKKPLISVIMPVYNRKDLILNSIDSVLSQSYENFELIIVDDASSDGTAELLRDITHDKISVYFHDENQDASAARNTALSYAKGEYIAYLDSDNLFDEDYLKASIGAFIQFPDAMAIYSAQKRYDFYDSELTQILYGHLNESLLFNQNYIDINCFVHKKEVIDELGGFDEELSIGEDWDLILKINRNYTIYSVPFLLSKYYLKEANNRKLNTTPSNREKIYKNNENRLCDNVQCNEKINIIIPIYKNDNNVYKCIDSILSCNLDNIKIIISNNNSDISIREFNDKRIKVINKQSNLGFSDSLINGMNFLENDSDIIILNQNAILSCAAIEIMRKYSYKLSNCGLIVSNHLVKDSKLIKKYAPHAHEDYWLDITPYGNISEMPIFFNGDVLELKYSPFFCTYIKRSVLNNININNHTYEEYNDFMQFISDYVRKLLNLKIYHISKANVFNNSPDKYEF